MRNFTTEDFKGSGQYLVYDRAKVYLDTGYLSTLMFKIGYLHGNNAKQRGQDNNYCLVAMSDGWIIEGYIPEGDDKVFKSFTSKQDLVDYLNTVGLTEEYRFATQEEVVRVVMYQKGRWR